MEKKERPTPQRLRGRGVEVPKALFYIIRTIYRPHCILKFATITLI
jgi:hypothetical protein